MCLQSLPLEAYSKNKRMKDGLATYCRNCFKKYKDEKKAVTPNYDYKVGYQKNYRLKNMEQGKCRFCTRDILPTSNRYCERHLISDMATKSIGTGDRKTIDVLLERLQNNPYCPYTGEKLILGVNAQLDHVLSRKNHPEKASDINNLEWVTSRANYAKDSLDKEDFIKLCKLVASRF